MLDKALIRGFYEPELVHAYMLVDVFMFRESENSEEDSGGGHFSSNLVC